MSISRKVWGLTLALTIGLTTICAAAASYPYGPFQYGQKNITVKGDLSYSGLSGIQTRPSIAYRHDINAHNAITGVRNPSSGYLKTVQFDIQPLPGVEPTDAFKDKSGYHLVPVEEELIKDLATKANGNAEFVWSNVKNLSHKIVKQYVVNGIPYVNIGSVFYLSGGGDPDMQSAGGNGVSSPLFKTTYKTTPWPSIPILEQTTDGSLHIKALAHSIYDTSITGTITVNGHSEQQLFKKTDGISNYTVTYENSILLSDLSGIKEGDNIVTLTVTDAFGRTATKTITIQTAPTITGCPRIVLTHQYPPAAGQYTDQVATKLKQNGEKLRIGTLLAWSVGFFPSQCRLTEGLYGNHGLPGRINTGTVYSDINPNGETYHNIVLERWTIWLSDTPKGSLVESESESSIPLYLNVVDKRINKTVKQYTLQKGQKMEIPYNVHLTSSPYKLYILTPPDQRGFWDEQVPYGRTYDYPPELQDAITRLFDAAQK